MKVDLKGKVAVVTGGSSGIGKSIALELARNGCDVVVADINHTDAKQVILTCKSLGVHGMAVKADISHYGDVKKLFARIITKFDKVDILVNNAGIVETSTVENINENTWDRMMQTNLKGSFMCSKEAIKIMKKQFYGKIVNISSISAQTGGIHSGPAYSASKAGVICFTKSLAKALAPYSINVNCIAPGLVDAPMSKDYPPEMIETIPLKRKAKPEEVAYLVLFLVSEEAAYITGETININGGLLMD